MTDRELLELAAKAAGIEIKAVLGDTFWTPDGIMWNPLTEDGDALRLAVRLKLHLTPSDTHAWASHISVSATEPLDNDHYSATRRAIVRAAAEIGKYRG